MFLIAWSLLTWTLLNQTTVNPTANVQSNASQETGAVKLYQQASSLIAAGEASLAIPVLEQLISEFPDSILSPIAAGRVAEHHLAQNEPRQAVEILLKWAPLAFTDPAAQKLNRIDSDFANRTLQLTKKSFALLPESDANVLESAMSKIPEDSPLHRAAVSELAKRSAQNHNYQRAIELLQSLGANASPNELQLRNVDLPLALLGGNPSEGEIAWVESTLSKDRSLNQTQRFSLQFAIAEAHRHAGRTQQALTSLEQLSKSFEQIQTAPLDSNTPQVSSDLANSSSSTTSGSALTSPKQLQDWLATVELRRSEIFLSKSDFVTARSIALRCIERFPSYSSLSQFRFVVAKCDIAEINFDAARQQLASVIESGRATDSTSTIVSGASVDQAWWMLGELDFMQRNYAGALERYAMVYGSSQVSRDQKASLDLQGSRESAWKPRALLQAAKCYEMMGNPADAYSAYQAIITQYPQSDVAPAARQRLKALDLPKTNSATSQPTTSPTTTLAR